MTKYFYLIRITFKHQLAYLSNAWLSVIGSFLGMFVMLNVWQALYANRETIRNVSLEDMITYVILSGIVSGMASSGLAYRIAGQVRDGSIGMDLIKPISIRLYSTFQDIAGNLYSIIVMSLPPAIVFGIIYGFHIPAELLSFLLFFIALLNGIAIVFSIQYIFGILAFWFKSAEYVTFFNSACMTLFAGSAVPLWFYPNFLRSIAMALPFRLITFEPIAIYLGKTTGQAAYLVIGLQIIWIIVLNGLGRLMWKHVDRHITINGG